MSSADHCFDNQYEAVYRPVSGGSEKSIPFKASSMEAAREMADVICPKGFTLEKVVDVEERDNRDSHP